MKVLIAGIDGYLGWTLAQHLGAKGHEISGIDNFCRRSMVNEIGSWSATPIKRIDDRIEALKEIHGIDVDFFPGDLKEYHFTKGVIKRVKPDAIVHFGEQPSAPYSMMDAKHAIDTQVNNLVGTMNIVYGVHREVPKCHILKLGTMGEYGTPNLDIPEGFFDIDFRGRRDRLPFPRLAGSWYHWSKVHDSNNIMFACKLWGLRSTDIMQGVVYGTRIDTMSDDRLLTRFDFDEAFGTAINRFCAQSVIGHQLTPYGRGGQRRGFIALRDSMQCLTLALENPPQEGEYRVFNQFDEVYNIYELAEHVVRAAKKKGIDAEISNIENPRVEAEEHHYNPDSEGLRKLGFKPTKLLPDELSIMFDDLKRFRDRIEEKRERIMPRIKWRGGAGERKD
jgi:UDP-sulfoquinovose synthase